MISNLNHRSFSNRSLSASVMFPRVLLPAVLILFIHGVFSSAPTVTLDDCTFLGEWDSYAQDDDVATFKSIPYIQPPVGDLRWAPSVRVEDYSDTPNICQSPDHFINATYHHSMCWQPWYPVGIWPPPSENCVHLVCNLVRSYLCFNQQTPTLNVHHIIHIL